MPVVREHARRFGAARAEQDLDDEPRFLIEVRIAPLPLYCIAAIRYIGEVTTSKEQTRWASVNTM